VNGCAKLSPALPSSGSTTTRSPEWLQLTIALREAATSSDEGRDSAFVVQVPLHGAVPTVENDPLSFLLRSRDGALHGLEILLVVDERDARDAMTAVLESARASVVSAIRPPPRGFTAE